MKLLLVDRFIPEDKPNETRTKVKLDIKGYRESYVEKAIRELYPAQCLEIEPGPKKTLTVTFKGIVDADYLCAILEGELRTPTPPGL